MPSSWSQDVKFAARQFRRSPGFTGAVILTLALGIGATTAIFSLVDGILLRPLPFPHADRLVAINTLEFPNVTTGNPNAGEPIDSSYPNFFDWQRQNHTFGSIASYQYTARLFSKANGEGARVVRCGRVSANLFSTLGVAPVLGRSFTPEEERPGHRAVMLSHELWASMFGGSRDVIGQIVKVSHEPSIIVGVMPAGFHYPVDEPAQFWATYAADTEGASPVISNRELNDLQIVGRLKPSVTL